MRKDLVLVGLIVAILALMVIPLDQGLIDVLITLNISLAVLLLMVSVYLKHPSDFSTFPSVILIGTAFRLALSIGTTRLILSEADGGQIIETFGDFVVSGSIAIGLVIFLIITVVQFLVVTKGAERVAEVGARFALDALPGKQMSIDADLRAGNIEQEEADAMRSRLDRDSRFFGAMDGAMKFVKGDAIAGLIIIVINLVGGVAVGVSVHGMSLGGALSTYSLLTIGDGLVAQIPALIMSLCAGVIVTRANNSDNADLGSDIFRELISDPRVPGVASGVILGMGFIPGFPLFTFAAAAGTLFLSSIGLRRRYAREAVDRETDEKEAEQDAAEADEKAQDDQNVLKESERIVCYFGSDLGGALNLAELKAELQDMFVRLHQLRGVAFPIAGIEISDQIGAHSLSIELDNVPVFRRDIPQGCVLVAGGLEIADLLGANDDQISYAEWFDEEICWVEASFASVARALKISTYENEAKFAELIFRVYERHLGTLFSKSEFDAIMDEASKLDADGVKELEGSLTRPAIYQILRYLVEDGVPLRPLRLVIDSLAYWNQVNEGANPVLLSECLRGSMKRQLCHIIAGEDNVLGIAMIDPELENLARDGLGEARRSGGLSSLDGLVFDPDVVDQILGQFMKLQQAHRSEQSQLAVVASNDIRRRLRNFLAANKIHLPVLAPHEISPDVRAYPIELISLNGIETQAGEDDYDEQMMTG